MHHVPKGNTMLHIIKHTQILGHRVKDKVTDITGVATSVAFDLYGCVQVVVHPGVNKDGQPKESLWFDIARLEIIADRVMPVPDFFNNSDTVASGNKGPADKPRGNNVA